MNVHELVKVRLKALDLRQEELAEKIGVSQSQVSAALNGKNLTTLNRIVEILVEEYGDSRSTYFPSDNARLDRLEERMKRADEALQKIMESQKELIRGVADLSRRIAGKDK